MMYGIIPFLLFSFGAIATLFLVSPLSFSLLTYQRQPQVIQQPTNNVLTKGERFIERIYAEENNLGIIAIHFSNTNTVEYENEDQLEFILTDLTSNKVIYKNYYRSGLLTSSKYFPFGFPKIVDSKGKQYQITITSLKGNINNALTLDKNKRMNQISYDYSKDEIIGTPENIFSFLVKKYALIFADNQTLFIAFEYFMPFIFYSIFLAFNKRGSANPYTNELLLLFIILYDIFLIPQIYGIMLFGLLSIWVIFIIRHKLESSITYLFSGILFVIALLLQYFQFIMIANKASDWGYFFLVIGTVQLYKEIRNRDKENISVKTFLKQLR